MLNKPGSTSLRRTPKFSSSSTSQAAREYFDEIKGNDKPSVLMLAAMLIIFVICVFMAPQLFHTRADVQRLHTQFLEQQEKAKIHTLSLDNVGGGEGYRIEGVGGNQPQERVRETEAKQPPSSLPPSSSSDSEPLTNTAVDTRQERTQEKEGEEIKPSLVKRVRNKADKTKQDNVNVNIIPPSSSSQKIIQSPASLTREEEIASRLNAVQMAIAHAWRGYSTHAFGHDEVRPTTNRTNDSWNGWGVTMVDGVDTVMLAVEIARSTGSKLSFAVDGGERAYLEKEIGRVREQVVNGINFDVDHSVSFFETTIRYSGGFLSAYELSKDNAYLDKAVELTRYLAPAFSTPLGLPYSALNVHTGVGSFASWTGNSAVLAEVGSCQLELTHLAYHYTGESTSRTNPVALAKKARNIYSILGQLPSLPGGPGLYPVYLDPHSGHFSTGRSSRITFGSLADSFYEYLLKLYILTDGKDQEALRMYNRAMDTMMDKMTRTKTVVRVFRKVGKDGGVEEERREETRYTFLGDLDASTGQLNPTMEHLSCFVPGLLALGAYTVMRKEEAMLSEEEHHLRLRAPKHLALAKELGRTCASTYFASTTGLGPDEISFEGSDPAPIVVDVKGDIEDAMRNAPDPISHLYRVTASKYILRPETLESIFVLYRVTNDPKYQDWGWRIFEALEKNCRTPSAYSGLSDVNQNGKVEDNWNDSMQSFFMAETLKYLLLLFSPPTIIPLSEFVFNTEAHPLRILRE